MQLRPWGTAGSHPTEPHPVRKCGPWLEAASPRLMLRIFVSLTGGYWYCSWEVEGESLGNGSVWQK